MTSYRPGEILLVAFPFVQSSAAKQRPALVIADTGDNDVLLARVTTQSHSARFDIPIADWKGAGLLAPSIVRLHKLATIEKALVSRRLGTLMKPDYDRIKAMIPKLASDW